LKQGQAIHELSQQHINITYFKCTLKRRKGKKLKEIIRSLINEKRNIRAPQEQGIDNDDDEDIDNVKDADNHEDN
jgi:hypothetical protein